MRARKKCEIPPRRPPLTTRTRRGLYTLLDELRGDYHLTLAMLRSSVRSKDAERAHELDAALDWIDDMHRFHVAKGRMRRKILSGSNGKRGRQLDAPPPSVGN